MSTFEYRVTVQVERESGKFAARDDISEKITEAIEQGLGDADLSGLGADSDSTYNVTEQGVEEMDSKAAKAAWADHETRVREELPGDAELRAKVKELREQLAAAQSKVTRLTEQVEMMQKPAETAEEGDVYIVDYSGSTAVKRYIDSGRHGVTFALPDIRTADDGAKVRMRRDAELRVSIKGTGENAHLDVYSGESLLLQQSALNLVQIKPGSIR